jgi:hypothetical protein
VKSIEKVLLYTRGGCPKRKVCSFHRAENQTCLHGPYAYCGKYRSIVDLERKEKALLV